jgi:hypothetical protein
VRCEGCGAFQLNPYQFFGLVGILLAAFVAADLHGAIQHWGREKGVGLGQRDLVREKQVLSLVKSVVLAEHYPIVLVPSLHPDPPETHVAPHPNTLGIMH